MPVPFTRFPLAQVKASHVVSGDVESSNCLPAWPSTVTAVGAVASKPFRLVNAWTRSSTVGPTGGSSRVSEHGSATTLSTIENDTSGGSSTAPGGPQTPCSTGLDTHGVHPSGIWNERRAGNWSESSYRPAGSVSAEVARSSWGRIPWIASGAEGVEGVGVGVGE